MSVKTGLFPADNASVKNLGAPTGIRWLSRWKHLAGRSPVLLSAPARHVYDEFEAACADRR